MQSTRASVSGQFNALWLVGVVNVMLNGQCEQSR